MKSRSLPLLVVVLSTALAARAGDVTGRVVLAGTPPPETKIDLADFPTLAKRHPNGLTTRRYQVSSEGGLQNVLVSIRGDFNGRTFEPPKAGVVFDHQEGWFAPYVMGIQAGQSLDLRHPSDDLYLQATAKTNKGFRYIGKGSHIFRMPETGIRLSCECHLWNFAFLSVFDHPFFAVTGRDGNYRISGVPAGTYALDVYHPKAGTFSAEVVVTDGEVRVPDVAVKPR
ncbi:MAG: carboxypeptidase regulatory-like domain-containing protein [Verrucomicrobia bacterium]|nr:carboxypeptidase regulatory-like domain-containing protein [Verrucomicrobiota bacterium]